jgi:hypothetical protein
MTHKIKLIVESPTRVAFKGRDSFRIRVTASSGVNMPEEIFGHQKTLVDPYTEETQDEFVFVCSPYDLSIYPANVPDEEQSPAFFRKSTVDILVPGIDMAEEVITSISEQVDELVKLLNRLDTLDEQTSTWYSENP